MDEDQVSKPDSKRLEWVTALATVGTLGAALWQLPSINSGLSSSAAAAVYGQQQTIDAIFVEKPEMRPYFYEKAEPSSEDEPVAMAVAYQLLDHFEHVRYQIDEGLFEAEESAWNDEYFRSTFASSPVLCRALVAEFESYDAYDEGSMWSDEAQEPCTALGITPQ